MATHLLVRSSYSLLKGTMNLKDMVSHAKRMGFGAVALSDYHVLHGALEFQLEAQKQGIKPIFGMEVTFKHEDELFNSLLIAKNNEGFKHLMKVSLELSESSSVSLEFGLSQDCYFIAFSENGPFEAKLLKEDWEGIVDVIQLLKSFDPEFLIGISHQESSYFKTMNAKLIDIAGLNDISSVALSKVYYELETDDVAHRVLSAVEKGTYLEDKTLVSAPNRYFYNPKELEELYTSDLLSVTDKIAGSSQVDLLALTTKLPVFPSTHPVSNKVYLSELAHFGLSRRLNDNVSDIYTKRLDYELSVINDMDFHDYFLIVYDVIRYAKRNKVYVGPGRGSSAGSLVAYALGITEVDPIEFDLLFERFLNPERISMPDIDIDFPDDKRQFVIDYVREKYGDERVAHIVTYGTMRARQAFRDVGRVLQIPIRTVDAASKLINPSADLGTNYQTQTRFRAMVDGNDLLKRCFELSQRIEGLLRHVSIHAAGIVLSSLPLVEVVPLMRLSDGASSIQYDMVNIERIGLIKIDFLGLRNLSIIDNISHQIPDFSINDIPYDDKATFDLIAKGQTVGLFQLESEGMTQLLVKMKPNRFMDIVDTIALYRPGPMENIPEYLKNRANPNQVKYLHKDLEELTKDTNGILIYQEQIMLVAQRMAGFSLARADILRKAMSKKDAKELSGLKKEFIEGAQAQGYDEALSHELFNLVERFANYGFNKSHSVAYAMIAYQMAYLKANYPYLFYTYLLTSVIGSDGKTAQYLDECRKRGILLMSPNLERSYNHYTLEGHKIRIPFTIIKGISDTISLVIIKERDENGAYQSFYDAIARLTLVGLKQNHFKSLIQAGAFDYFGFNRLSALASLDEAIRYANIISVQKDGRISLDSSLVSEPLFTQVDDNERQQLQDEYAVLGFYFSDHPAVHLKNKHQTDSLINITKGEKVYRIIAMLDRIKLHRAKNGKQMAFLNVSDDTGSLDLVMFPNVYERLAQALAVGDLVLVKGTMRDEGSLIIQDFHVFDK